MKYVMLTYTSAEAADAWDAMSDEGRKAEIDRHIDWFRAHGDRILGGEELAYPQQLFTIEQRAGKPLISDGPYPETKEVLGGVIFFEADTLEEAQAIAASWPNLEGKGNRVVLSPGGSAVRD